MSHHVRRADRERDARGRALFAAFRFFLYGCIGLAGEVGFYNLVRLGRLVPGLAWFFQFDWRVDPRLGLDGVWHAPLVALYGQCSLWMFGVYAMASFGLVEPIYRRLHRRAWWLRAAAYGVAILALEAVSGLVLWKLTGYRIWLYDDRYAIVGMTSLAILPIWFVTGLGVEAIYRELMDPRIRHALEAELEEAAGPA